MFLAPPSCSAAILQILLYILVSPTLGAKIRLPAILTNSLNLPRLHQIVLRLARAFSLAVDLHRIHTPAPHWVNSNAIRIGQSRFIQVLQPPSIEFLIQ